MKYQLVRNDQGEFDKSAPAHLNEKAFRISAKINQISVYSGGGVMMRGCAQTWAMVIAGFL